jgi:glutamyl-tRNA reductase
VEELKVIAITHKDVGLELIGKLHLSDAIEGQRLQTLKEKCGLEEIIFLSTCNRVELIVNHEAFICDGQIRNILSQLQPSLSADELNELSTKALLFSGKAAFRHLLEVTASLHSMILGEREIITQVRKAFEKSREYGVSGDLLRVVMRKTIEGAKRVYTETHISRRQVSIVSLAWQSFQAKRINKDSRVLLIGAGQVIGNFSRFLKKENYSNITVANRSLSKAELLAQDLGGKAISLDGLKVYSEGIDVIVSCTGASDSVVDSKLYRRLIQDDTSKKVLIDLALPHDIDPSILSEFDVDYTGMPQLKLIADENLNHRAKELGQANSIIDQSCDEFDEEHSGKNKGNKRNRHWCRICQRTRPTRLRIEGSSR